MPAGLVHDISDKNCQAQNGTCTRCQVFCDFHTLIFNKPNQKSSEKLLCLYFFLFLSVMPFAMGSL